MYGPPYASSTPVAQNSVIFGKAHVGANDSNEVFRFGATSAVSQLGRPALTQTRNNTVKDTPLLLPKETLESCKCEYCDCYLSVGPVCLVENKVACGRCRRECEGVRLLVVETLAKQFHFPCRYKNFGCNEVLNWKLMDSHEIICDFKEIFCIIKGCDWTGAKSDLKSHFDEKHVYDIINSRKGVTINLTEKKISNFLYTWKNKVFMIRLSNEGDKIYHQVKFFCTGVEASMYVYDICIYDSEKKLMFLNQKLQSFFDDIGLLNSGLCITVLQCVFVNNNNVNISFRIKSTLSEPEYFSARNIECPVCLEPMVGNIMIGSCGHSFCEKCKKSLWNCPSCRATLSCSQSGQETRNYFLENIIKKLSIQF